MRMLAIGMSVIFVLAVPAWAEHNRGRGRDEQTTGTATQKAVKEAANAALDELEGKPQPAAKQSMPPGLQKQGKTPPGWSKGRKEGWNKQQEPKKEGFFGRLTRVIMRSDKAKQEQKPPSQ